MDPELPKSLASAVDVAKKLSAEIGAAVEHLLGLKSSLDQAHPALDLVHKNIISGKVPDAPDAPLTAKELRAEKAEAAKAEKAEK